VTGKKKGRTMNPLTQFKKTFFAPILVLAGLLLLATSQSHAQGVPGTYELSFCPGSILYVNQELILHAYVADSLGNPAAAGSVSFQACSRGSIRSLGTDPQPSAACDIYGTAQWVSWEPPRKVAAGSCDLPGCLPAETGNACGFFGAVQNPRTIGFRFKYFGQGSGIANGISESKDATFLPLS
jgi:hypothetical protein